MFCRFSEILDLSEYTKNINLNDNDCKEPVYQLGAILMHVGKSAYSGHYMAHIKNFETNDCYNFNDESIQKIKRKQQLGSIPMRKLTRNRMIHNNRRHQINDV